LRFTIRGIRLPDAWTAASGIVTSLGRLLARADEKLCLTCTPPLRRDSLGIVAARRAAGILTPAMPWGSNHLERTDSVTQHRLRLPEFEPMLES
jgi:hypothetical protein